MKFLTWTLVAVAALLVVTVILAVVFNNQADQCRLFGLCAERAR